MSPEGSQTKARTSSRPGGAEAGLRVNAAMVLNELKQVGILASFGYEVQARKARATSPCS